MANDATGSTGIPLGPPRSEGEKSRAEQNERLEVFEPRGQGFSIDRSPGAASRGLDQQYNWRGPETEVNLTYGEAKQQGYLFIESRLLAPRFNEGIFDGTF